MAKRGKRYRKAAEGVDPESAAKALSEAPRVVSTLSVVDERPYEVWRKGKHVSTDHNHPLVQAQIRRWEAAREKQERGE